MKLNGSNMDTMGGIEGLPLQLMIVIIVATMGTAIIVGWMGDIETPHSIGDVYVQPDNIRVDGIDISPITVIVTDQDGDPLAGATVVLYNHGILNDGDTAFGTTGSDGSVIFDKLTMRKIDSARSIEIQVTKPDYGEKVIEVMVIP